VKSAIRKGKIIVKDSDKMETYLDNIINSLPNFKEKEKNLNNEIRKLNNNKNINIISKVNELKRKHVTYNQELKDIEIYIKESENELLKNKNESDNLLSSIETYINRLSKNNYHISISK
jgi:DNA repair ATPase RecN